MFKHDNATVHQARLIRTWFVKIGGEEFKWPAEISGLNPADHIWDELEC